MKNLGIVLIVIGIIMMVVTGFNYITKEEVVDIGPIEINQKKNNPVRWSPLIGGVLLVGGIVLVAMNKRK